MASPEASIGALRAVADRLDELGLDYAFVGGAIVNLLLDDPAFAPVRPTDDVDVILGLVTAQRYSEIEERLRRIGFAHDTREGAPLCRWTLGKLVVDIMPVDGARLGLNTAWFAEALASATVREFSHTRLKLVSPVAFLATKLTAFADRGRGDYRGSHDLEDLIAVIDGRNAIVAEVQAAPATLRDYLRDSIRGLMADARFDEALSGHLPADDASQQRLPALRRKLRAIAAL
jgi:predicted nucleotidyltransferase